MLRRVLNEDDFGLSMKIVTEAAEMGMVTQEEYTELEEKET